MLFKFKNIFRILFFQICSLLFIFLITYFFYNLLTAMSVLYGGISSIFPSILFFLTFFFLSSEIKAKKIVNIFYIAGVIKIFSLIFICVLMFKIGLSSPIGYFFSLCFIQFMFWIGCFLFLNEDINLYEYKS